jgi:hypothetical protein
MGKRGKGSFRKLDALRAIRTAKEAGLTPGMVEIITADGVTYRVYSDTAATPVEGQENVWDEVLKKNAED